jgi:multidrug transporter EmrE-like cation transporter
VRLLQEVELSPFTIGTMKTFLFVILATALEATGDAVLRLSLHSNVLSYRIGMFVLGAVLLTVYGTTLNLAPVDFGTITGLYVGMVFVSFQVTNYLFFHAVPKPSMLLGGALILAGSAIVYGGR